MGMCGFYSFGWYRLHLQVIVNLDLLAAAYTIVRELIFPLPFQLPVQNGPIVHRGDGEPSGVPVAVMLLPVFALTLVAVWAFVRYRKQL